MRRPGGYAVLTAPTDTVVNFDGMRREFVCEGVFEADTYTCFHCNSVVHVQAKADVNAVGFCRNCMRPICQRCADRPCVPFEKQLEQIERRAETDRHYGDLLRR